MNRFVFIFGSIVDMSIYYVNFDIGLRPSGVNINKLLNTQNTHLDYK